jgi:hypothetical protein
MIDLKSFDLNRLLLLNVLLDEWSITMRAVAQRSYWRAVICGHDSVTSSRYVEAKAGGVCRPHPALVKHPTQTAARSGS